MSAETRKRTGPDRPGAGQWVPAQADTSRLATAAEDCRGCELFAQGTRTVFGSGPCPARTMLVGEQPGDREDRAGEPFVGPAGRVLDRALHAAHLSRDELYLTNAVKHFRHVERGNRRLHRTPLAGHIHACKPWLEAELAAVRPQFVVLLGAVAGRAVYGPRFRVADARGHLQAWPDEPGINVLATIHPSAVLRADDPDAMLADLVADLEVVTGALS